MKPNLLFIMALLALTSVAGAQPSQMGAIRVTLVAGPSPSKGGRTEVVRRAQRTPRDVVIVDKNATAVDLAAALAMINALRSQYGDSLTTDLRASPEVVRPGRKFDKSPYHLWLIDQLVRLRTAKTAELSDLGAVKAVQITLPAPAGAIITEGSRK